MAWDDDADEEWIDEELPDDDDVLECPSCHREVHEDTQQCPHCGDWITPVYPRSRSKRWAWGATAALLILSIILWTIL